MTTADQRLRPLLTAALPFFTRRAASANDSCTTAPAAVGVGCPNAPYGSAIVTPRTGPVSIGAIEDGTATGTGAAGVAAEGFLGAGAELEAAGLNDYDRRAGNCYDRGRRNHLDGLGWRNRDGSRHTQRSRLCRCRRNFRRSDDSRMSRYFDSNFYGQFRGGGRRSGC